MACLKWFCLFPERHLADAVDRVDVVDFVD
jgi:hypothetical protein